MGFQDEIDMMDCIKKSPARVDTLVTFGSSKLKVCLLGYVNHLLINYTHTTLTYLMSKVEVKNYTSSDEFAEYR